MTLDRPHIELRERAERLLEEGGSRARELGREDLERLVHELEVHQIELELQNDELQKTQFTLERLRDRYFDLYDLAPVGYLTLDEEGIIVEANLTAAELLGVERAPLIGQRLLSFVHAGDVAKAHHYFAKLLIPDSEPLSLEVVLCRHDGTLLSALLDSTPVRGGLSARCRTALVDLTEQRRFEGLALEHSAVLGAVLDSVGDGILMLDRSWRVESANRAAARIFACPPGHLVGITLERLVPALKGVGLAHLWAQQTVGSTWEVVGRRYGGSLFALEVGVSEFVVGGGRRLMLVLRDVTERNEKAAALRDSLARFQQITEQIEDVFYVADATNGEVRYISPGAESVFGCDADPDPADRLRNREGWLSWVHPADRERVLAGYRQLPKAEPFDQQYRIIRADGQVRYVHERAFPRRDAGEVTGVVRDVTRARKLEQQLHAAQKMEALGTLASGIAHDFNNLLMALAGSAQVALAKLAPDHPARRDVSRGLDMTMRGATLTRRLVSFSSKRAFGAEVAIELDSVVRGAKDLFGRLLGDELELQITTNAPGLQVLVEAGEIQQMMLNLATNSRDAMPSGGRLVVQTRLCPAEAPSDSASDFICLSITDSGDGMTEETRSRAFEPFYTTKDVGKGTGLGLSTVYAIMKRIGGRVTLDSDPGCGTTVTLHFPVYAGEPAPAEAAPAVPCPVGGTESILLVEDDPLVRATVQNYLDALGYRSHLAANGEQARAVVKEARSPRIAVLLTDVMMPGQLGGDLANELGRDDLRVLFMSAHPRETLVEKGQLRADDHFIEKPFDQPTLAVALRRLIDA